MSSSVLDSELKYHRSKLWQIGFFTLNNTATNLYIFLIGFLSYYAAGIAGLAVVLVSTLLGAARLFDGLIDPTIGYIIDKTETKFGKFRPIIVFGNIITIISVIMIFTTHLLPEGFRLVFIVFSLVVHKIGYSLQTSATKAGQTVLTNDPKQRPLYMAFDGVYNIFVFTVGQFYVANYLVAKYGDFTMGLFIELVATVIILATIFTILALIGISSKDRKEYYGLGEETVETKSIRDYWQVIKGNRQLQLLTLSASMDKLGHTLGRDAVVTVMLFGILLGNYGLSGTIGLITVIPGLLITFFVTGLARKTGLRKAYLTAAWIGVLSYLAFIPLFLILDDPTVISLESIGIATIIFILLRTFAQGFGGAPTTLVVPMIADVSDYETAKSGRYVAGMFGTIFSFIDQLVSSLSPLIVGFIVAAIGFGDAYPTVTDTLTPSLFTGLLVLAFLLPAICLLIAAFAMHFYKLDRKKMEEVQDTIAEAKGKSKISDDTAAV
ncbi:glucuronide permease [Oceanobacillus sp. 143]|uniref:Glucuronide permease n=1 Tax=Oceanobacillus zhaokaii TaxID=2052660 RepID=A0A345PCB8_9BACI|nr:MFS transporter [Oceanobacillus zhaokaii]AXI07648.1 glucuronide permease [Oceanobacillus zhaokaii]QGS67835.1 glucuronide permease [Oceanobacillus sp. 143]